MTSHNEDEYFAKETAEKLRKLHREQSQALDQAQKDALKAQHANRCPSCGAEMRLLPEYKGVSLLRCFECGGAFIKHGDAQKLHANSQRQEHKWVEAVLNWIRSDEP